MKSNTQKRNHLTTVLKEAMGETMQDIDIHKMVPNWKSIKIEEIPTKLYSSMGDNIGENFNLKEDIKNKPMFENAKENYPEWFLRKYGKMSPDEMILFAQSNEKNRKQVRDDMEKWYKWYVENAPNSLWKKISMHIKNKELEKGIDPHDVWYRGYDYEKKTLFKLLALVPAILQIMLWIYLSL